MHLVEEMQDSALIPYDINGKKGIEAQSRDNVTQKNFFFWGGHEAKNRTCFFHTSIQNPN